MKHINELSVTELEGELALAIKQIDLCGALGIRKQLRTWKAYYKALISRLNELKPVPELDSDQLLNELLNP